MAERDELETIKRIYSWDWMSLKASFGEDFLAKAATVEPPAGVTVPESLPGTPTIIVNTSEVGRYAGLVGRFHQRGRWVRGAVIPMPDTGLVNYEAADSYPSLLRHLARAHGATEEEAKEMDTADCIRYVQKEITRSYDKGLGKETVIILFGLERLTDGSQALTLQQMAGLKHTSVYVTTSKPSTEVNDWLTRPGGCWFLGMSVRTRGNVVCG